MKIFIAAYEPDRNGGGWSFQRNFAKCMKDNLSSYEDADIFFIASASMVQREEVDKAKKDGKKIVLRLDNIIRNSRNRNTGMTRMRDMAAMADLVVFQSEFAMQLLGSYLKPKNHTIIMNATDQDIFHSRDRYYEARYLYTKFSSDETKNWEMARSAFQSFRRPNKHLNIVGRFDSKLEEYGFDFYLGESITYEGVIEKPEQMAAIYRESDSLLYSYFQDCCSNTLIESLCCGLEIFDCYGMLGTGGAHEIMTKWLHEGDFLNRTNYEYFALPRMADEYYAAMGAL